MTGEQKNLMVEVAKYCIMIGGHRICPILRVCVNCGLLERDIEFYKRD